MIGLSPKKYYMGIRQDRDVYKLRTLSYYQKEGGVYNELITVLTQLRSDPKTRLSMSPVKVLNEACRRRDEIKGFSLHEYMKSLDSMWFDLLREKNSIETMVIISTIYVLNERLGDTNPELLGAPYGRLIHDDIVFPFFQSIVDDESLSTPYYRKLKSQIDDLKKQLADKDTLIWQLKQQKYDDAALHFEEENNALKNMYSELAMESMQKEIDYKAQIADLEEQCKNKDYELSRINAKQVKKPITDVDKVLSFDNIMAYIESRGCYDNCDQLFKMLDKLIRRIVTDEQLAQIDALEAKLIAAKYNVTILNDIHDNSGDIMPGTVNLNK